MSLREPLTLSGAMTTTMSRSSIKSMSVMGKTYGCCSSTNMPRSVFFTVFVRGKQHFTERGSIIIIWSSRPTHDTQNQALFIRLPTSPSCLWSWYCGLARR